MIVFNVEVEGKEKLVAALKKMNHESRNAMQPIVDKMSASTQNSAKNMLAPHRNKGDLEKSILHASEKTSSTSARAEVYTYMPYAKYVEFGTKGSWTTSIYSKTIDNQKMKKYPRIPIVYVGPAQTPSYAFHGQKPKEFMKNAYEATCHSNINFAKYTYLQAILRGVI